MDDLPFELIDICLKYISNANLYKLYLTSLQCHVLGTRHLKHCKYAVIANKRKIRINREIVLRPADYLAFYGDLGGVKYFNSIGKSCTEDGMYWAVLNGRLNIVKYLHSIGKYTKYGLFWAYHNRHVPINGFKEVFEFLKSVVKSS